LVKEDWEHPLPSSPPISLSMPSLPSDFDIVMPPKTILKTVMTPVKTYVAVVPTPANEQMKILKKYIAKK
jgi:hypothetical protein